MQHHRRQRNCRLQESARGCDNRRQPEESDGRPACGECCAAVWLMPFRIPEPGYCWERRENPPVPCLGDSFRKNLQIFRLDQSKHDHRKTGTVPYIKVEGPWLWLWERNLRRPGSRGAFPDIPVIPPSAGTQDLSSGPAGGFHSHSREHPPRRWPPAGLLRLLQKTPRRRWRKRPEAPAPDQRPQIRPSGCAGICLLGQGHPAAESRHSWPR